MMHFAAILAFLCTVGLVRAATVVVLPASLIVSDNATDRLAPRPANSWEASAWTAGSPCPANSACITDAVAQTIDGFGGSFMRAGATVLAGMSATRQDQIMAALFDPDIGAGFTLGKVPIGATDFGVPYWYTYEDTLGSFSIAHDLSGVGAIIPYVLRARTYMQEPLWLQATMDYPPDYMINKTTPMPNAQLNSTWYPQLAQYYLAYAQAFEAAAGFPLSYVSLFNEPYSSYITPTEDQIIDLLVNHVGPLFRKTAGAPGLTWGEQYGRRRTYSTGPYIMNSPGVQNFVDILFYHGYDCGDGGAWYCTGPEHLNTTCPELDIAMSNITAYGEMYSRYKMWMTEVCYAIEFEDYPSNTSMCPALPRTDFEDGLQWGRMLFGDMLAGTSGWIYWNLILNASGGPYLYSPEHNDPWNNIQHPVLIADPDTDTFTLTGCYYFMAHFSKYVRRGMQRAVTVRSSDLPANVYVVAFTNASSGAYVVEVMNDNVGPATVSVVVAGRSLLVQLPAVSISTVLFSAVAVFNTTVTFQCVATLQPDQLRANILAALPIPKGQPVTIFLPPGLQAEGPLHGLKDAKQAYRSASFSMRRMLEAADATVPITLVFQSPDATYATSVVAKANSGDIGGVSSAVVVMPPTTSPNQSRDLIIGACVGGFVVLLLVVVFTVRRSGSNGGDAEYVPMNMKE